MRTGRKEIASTYVIRDQDQLRALTDPKRLQILKALMGSPKTAAQLAKSYKIAPSDLDSHLKELKRVGLIRSTRGGRAKSYQAIAQNLAIDRELFRLDEETFLKLLESILTLTKEEIRESTKKGLLKPAEGGHVVVHKHIQGSPEEIEALCDLIQSLPTLQKAAGQHRYGCTLILYPVNPQEVREEHPIQLSS